MAVAAAGLVGATILFAQLSMAGEKCAYLAYVARYSTVTIELEGDGAPGSRVQLCIDGLGCAPNDEGSMRGVDGAFGGAFPLDNRSWQFSFNAPPSETATVRILDATGGTRTIQEVVPDWIQVGPAECEPPEATITVQVPPTPRRG